MLTRRRPGALGRILSSIALLTPSLAAGAGGSTSPAPASRSARPNWEFSPSRHGFAFTNSFAGSPLPQLFKDDRVPLAREFGRWIESHVPMPRTFGLCGGMSAAAADLFYAHADRPSAMTPPIEGDVWYRYIQRRQMDSLGPAMLAAAKFAQWMHLPDEGPTGTRALTLNELQPILDRIALGQLVPLGLVKARAGAAPIWNNHQVLAYAAARPAPDTVVLSIYDPNYPRDDHHTIRIDVPAGAKPDPNTPAPGAADPLSVPARPATTKVSITQRPGPTKTARGTVQPPDFSLRGLFAMPYTPHEPPLQQHNPGADAASPAVR